MNPIHPRTRSEPTRPNLLRRARDAALAAVVLAVAAAAPAAHAQTACDADIDGNGTVGAPDLKAVLGAWGPCASCAADVDDSGVVDGDDLGAVLSLWGESCNPLPWATVLEQSPDPAIVTSGSLRKAIAATGYPWRVRDNLTNIEMVLIPPGTFNMGCSASNQHGCLPNESPVHAVTLTEAFYMGRYEVTQAQWTARMGSNPSWFRTASAQVPAAQVPNRPVEDVSWNTIQGFLSVTGMRLPTEAEWEYACRAGTTTAFHGWPAQTAGTNNDTQVGNIAWFSGNASGQTFPVGGTAPNGLGLHDMSGNVSEWVNDWYSGSYYTSSPSTNPPGPASGTTRVLRGGSWAFVTVYLRSSFRYGYAPGNFYNYNYVGFRVARTPLSSLSSHSSFLSPSLLSPSDSHHATASTDGE
jgi:formylglycine-generating enzyme required for sulfatase activity